MRNLVSILIMLTISINIYGQNDMSKYYTKALEHIEKGNNSAAIRTLSRVIRQDNKYEQALLMRAEAKYNMKAYRSARVDVLEHINHRGISEKAITLLANIDYKLDDKVAALDTHITLNKILIGSSNNETKKSIVNERLGNLYYESNSPDKACEHWTTALVFGSKTAEEKASKYCKNIKTTSSSKEHRAKEKKSSNNRRQYPTYKKNRNQQQSSPKRKRTGYLDDEESAYDQMNKRKDVERLKKEQAEIEKQRRIEEARQRDEARSSKDYDLEEKDDDLYNVEDKNDDGFEPYDPPRRDSYPRTNRSQSCNEIEDDGTVNRIEIDDELTLELLGGGIGKRKISKTPNILILSEKDGKVAVDICINEKGEVTYALFNEKYSTLDTRHLVALAVRKAKQFKFESSYRDKQCGIIVFNIKQS